MEKKIAYLSLGSNMGDRRALLEKAIEMLSETDGIRVLNKSSFYETEPIGYTEQDMFLNCALEIECQIAPKELLEVIGTIEKALDRKRIIRWGPRTIDIDILFYEGVISDDPVLSLPHPRIGERNFVLLPLIEIGCTQKLGGIGLEDLAEENKSQPVRRLEDEKQDF